MLQDCMLDANAVWEYVAKVMGMLWAAGLELYAEIWSSYTILVSILADLIIFCFVQRFFT